MHLLPPAVQLSRQPPHNQWCSGDRGHCRKGAILWLSETDGRCRQKCRSPSPRETSHREAWAGLLVGNLGLLRQSHPPLSPKTCSQTRTHEHPKVAPQSIFTGLPASPPFSIPPVSAHRHPSERHFCGAGRGWGSHTSAAPGTPRAGLGMQGWRGR